MGNSIKSTSKTNEDHNNKIYDIHPIIDLDYKQFQDGIINKTKNELNMISSLYEQEFNILKNPGTFDELSKECKNVMPNFTEGGQIIFNNDLSNNFQVSHTIKLTPNSNDSSYRFGVTYVGGKGSKLYESYPIILGEIERSGNMKANILHSLNDNIRLKCYAQYHGDNFMGGQLVTDYIGDTFTASVGLGNVSLRNVSGILVGQYLQSITSKIALGAEFSYQYGMFLPEGSKSTFNIAAKYNNQSTIANATVGGNGIHLSYFKEASPQIKVGVEFNMNYDNSSTYTTIGYQANIPKGDFIFRGSMDTNWNICSVFEKRLLPMPFTLSLGALLNQKTGRFKLGCGINIR